MDLEVVETDGTKIVVTVPMALVSQFYEDNDFRTEFLRQAKESMEHVSEPEGNFKWAFNSTKLLIALRTENKENIRNPKCKKSTFWKNIEAKMRQAGYSVTAADCDRKLHNLKIRFKTTKDKKRFTGEGKQSWEYFVDMEGLFAEDVTINLPALLSSISTQKRKMSCTPSTSKIPKPSLPNPDFLTPIASTSFSEQLCSFSPISDRVEEHRLEETADEVEEQRNNTPVTPKRTLKNREAAQFRYEMLETDKAKLEIGRTTLEQLQKISKSYENMVALMKERNDMFRDKHSN